ncbi:MAG: hypothetical protein A2049_00525 [Elusimicrobia bacterium GWA2_62_23]|nr:MAG: hypothetical protein A2049_00525 [Elusimicrobia bacterium GWA2_62_23]OGR68470.1 MAG: hypothetical protein A2179_06070 [Elusimicrobia bacterium GWC2_63_65]
MTTLIKLQLRKNLLTFSVILGAVLASVPLALAIKSEGMPAHEAINLAMLYWGLAGLPLSALILSGIAGSEAAGEKARDTEQPLPVSQYRLLLSGLAAALLETFALLAVIYAILGFKLPLESLTGAQEQLLRFFVFGLSCLAVYGFTLSYVFRNGIAGAALAGAASAAILIPLTSTAIFQRLAFKLLPLWLINPLIAAAALAGGALALKLFSQARDRRSGRNTALLFSGSGLLAAPVLAAFASLMWLNYGARQVTMPAGNLFFPLYGTDSNLYPGREKNAALMLAQRPFYGEVFFVDKDGNRAVLERGGERRDSGFTYLMPDLTFSNGQSMTAEDGKTWALYSVGRRGRLAHGSIKEGFSAAWDIPATWSMELLGGKEPGILDRRDDAYYFAPLPPGAGGLEWKKVASRDAGYLRFLGEKYLKDGLAAEVSKDGKTLEHKGKRWTLPGEIVTRAAVPGVRLTDGLNFLVPVRVKDDYSTYLCRPNGKSEMIWPSYFRVTQNLTITPDGTVWGVERRPLPPAGRSPNADIATALFYLLTPDGKAMSAVNTDGILRKAGITYGDIWPLRAQNGYLWFNAGNKFLVKAEAANPENAKFWKLPKVVRERHKTVSPSTDGVFIAGADGIYFMDWEGGSRKIN